MARKQLNNLVLLALFVGLIFLLGQTPLGLIPLGWCNVTLLVIPVAIGTIYMGLKSGMVLGLAFGATSMVSALIKPSVLVGTLMGSSPLAVVVMTFLPRLCIPLVIWGVYKLLAKKQKRLTVAMIIMLPLLSIPMLIWIVYRILVKKKKLPAEAAAAAVAAACGSLTNTILYLGLMLIFYMMAGIDNTAVLTAIGATAGGAGPCEAIAAALICPPILTALWRIRRQA